MAEHEHGPPRGPDALRPRGRRLTRQRQLVWEALTAEPDQHLSAENVVTLVQAELPSVNLSTVYRNLELLVDEGLARRTELGRDRAFYEPTHEHPHHHLVCEHCGDVTHVHSAALGDLGRCVHAATGFALSDREITLFGRCARC